MSTYTAELVWERGAQDFLANKYSRRQKDNPTGVLERNAERRFAMSVVTLRPKVTFSGAEVPTAEELDQLHHKAHEECYIANSVKSEVRVEPIA